MAMKPSFKIPGKPDKSNPNYAEALAKFWMVIAAVLIGVNMFFILTLAQMTPHLRMIAQVLTSPMNSSQFIQAEPFESEISDKNLIEEMLVRNYLTERYLLYADENDMALKWGPYGTVARMSTGPVYEEFVKSLGELPEKLRSVDYTQNIDIRRVNRQNNTWEVEFDIYRMVGNLLDKRTKVAVLESYSDPQFGYYRTGYANPYGFFIVAYRDAEKNQASY